MSEKKTAAKDSAVRLNLPPEDHRALRVAAAEAGVSMAEFARRAVLAEMARARKKSEKSA